MSAARWLRTLSPAHGPRIAQAVHELPVMPVYGLPRGVYLTKEDRYNLGFEFSLRTGAQGFDGARCMTALRRKDMRRGMLRRALTTLEPSFPNHPIAAVEDWFDRDDSLDLLVGADASSRGIRGKIYLLRAGGRSQPDFDRTCRHFLHTCGVSRAWFDAHRAQVGDSPSFLALDLLPGGRAAAKLYFAFEQPDAARAWLTTLGSPWLVGCVDEAIADASEGHEVGGLVVTVRGAGERTIDVTLHAHTGRAPTDGPLAKGFLDLEALARTTLRRGLAPSYRSWMDTGDRQDTAVYYQLGPQHPTG